MKRVIIYFLIVLAAVWLGSKVVEHPGYVIVAYQDWLVESTTWFLVLFLLLAFLVFHLLLNLIKNTFMLPQKIEHWWGHRKIRKSIQLTQKGYNELILGKWNKAEKRFVKSAKKSPLTFLNYILAAEAAEGKSDFVRRDYYLSKAENTDKKNAFAVETLRSEIMINNDQPELAINELTKLHNQKPKETYVLKLMTESYLMLGDYENLQKLLPKIKRAKVFDPVTYAQIEKDVFLHILKDSIFTDFSQIQTLWNKTPKNLRHDPDILISYAEHLNHWNRNDAAEDLIRRELKRTYDSTLMEYYATLKSKQPAKQVALGEKWLKENSSDPATLKAMGLMCLRNRLWGQAKDYFEALQKIRPSAENYSVLGYIYEKLGESDRALQYYRKGLKII